MTAAGQLIGGARITWSSSAPLVATVDTTGLVTARGSGSALVTAGLGTLIGVARIDVTGASVHAGLLVGTQRWTRAGNPHQITATVSIQDTLIIEAGVRVCAAADAEIGFAPPLPRPGGVLLVQGTAAEPVVLTACDPARPWGGIVADPVAGSGGGTRIVHALIEHALKGVVLSGFTIDSSRIRQIKGTAIVAGEGRSTIAHTVIDTVGGIGILTSNATATIEEVTIRNAGGDGISGQRSSLRLLGGAIIGSGGFGIFFDLANTPTVSEGRPIRITGGRAHPVNVSVEALARLLPNKAASDGWLGNARDTILVSGSASDVEVTVYAGLPWRAAGGIALNGKSVLRLEPGAVLSVGDPAYYMLMSGRVVSAGTATAPVRIISPRAGGEPFRLQLSGSAGDTSRLTHTHLSGVHLVVFQTLIAENVINDGGAFELYGAGSRLSDVVVLDAKMERHSSINAGVAVASENIRLDRLVVRGSSGTGVLVGAGGRNTQLSACTITGSEGAGVSFASGEGSRISGCNLDGNSGFGVAAGPFRIDARDNWWGDPAGPDGPAGDGVSLNVDVAPFRSAPATMGGAIAATVTISPMAVSVATATTVALRATARDAGNAIIPGEYVRWRSANPSIALMTGDGLVLGVTPGMTTITAIATSDTMRRASATVTVTAGAPVLAWAVPGGTIPSNGNFILTFWAATESEAYIGDADGLLHFDGSAWTRLTSVPGQVLLVRGSSAADVVVFGTTSAAYRFNGTSWRTLANVPINEFYPDDAIVLGERVVVAYSSGVIELDSGVWRQRLSAQFCRSLAAIDQNQIFVACGNGVFRYDGATWVPTGITVPAQAVFRIGSDLFATTSDGAVYRWNGTQWVVVAVANNTPGLFIADVDGSSEAGIFGASFNIGRAYFFDGATWLPITYAAGGFSMPQVQVIGNAVFLVGTRTVLRGLR